MATVTMNASAIGGTINTQFSGNIVVPANGTITVDTRDALSLLSAGAYYMNTQSRWSGVSAARAGSAGQIVASAALANGTATIANQPDVGRQLGLRIDPGAGTITAGQTVLSYIGNDGVATLDTVSLASSAVFTTNTSKGVLHLTSQITTALAGGSSPKMELTDTNSLALSVDPGFSVFVVNKSNVDGADQAVGTVASAAACITPTTAPNGTHTFGFAYSFVSPQI